MPPVQRQLGGLGAAPDADATAWISAAIRDFDYTVGSIVPPVFEAYARVFHPAWRGRDAHRTAVSWGEVARANGRAMHPAAEWGSIVGDTPESARQRQRDAFGAEVAAWAGLVEGAASFELPNRRMHLLRGALVAIEDFYESYDREPSSASATLRVCGGPGMRSGSWAPV
jgi:hypothetical protein